MNLTSQKLNQTPQHRPTPELDRENLDSLDWDSISSGSNSSVDEAPPFTREESLLGIQQTTISTSPHLTKEYLPTLGNGCYFYTTTTSPWRMTQEDIRLRRLTNINSPYSNTNAFYHKGFPYSVVTPIT